MTMKIPHHRQINDWTCGPASLQMALGAFGIRATQRGLMLRAGTNPRHGTTRAGLVRVLRAMGLRASARHGRTLAELDAARRGGEAVIILYIETEAEEAHYAMYLGQARGRVILNDPWHGPRFTLPRAEFLKRWRGSSRKWTRWALTVDKKPEA